MDDIPVVNMTVEVPSNFYDRRKKRKENRKEYQVLYPFFFENVALNQATHYGPFKMCDFLIVEQSTFLLRHQSAAPI